MGLLVWKRSVALVWYGHAFGFPDRHRAFGSGVGPPYRVPSVPPGGVRGFGFRSWWWFENWRVDASKKDSFLVYCFFGRTSFCRGFVLCSDRFVIISAKICCPVFAGFVAGGRVVAREGRMVDALADSTDEGRVRLR